MSCVAGFAPEAQVIVVVDISSTAIEVCSVVMRRFTGGNTSDKTSNIRR
jgi:hypothetical protein